MTPNRAPIARHTGPYTTTIGIPVILDARDSSDPDGNSIVKAHWVLRRDGVTVADVTTTDLQAAVVWHTAEILAVRLTVTDSRGATSAAVLTTLTVTPPVPTVDRVEIIAPAIVPVLEQVQFTARVVYSDGTVEDVTNTADWAVSDPTLATVDRGLVTGTQAGVGVLSASVPMGMRSVALTVMPPTPIPDPLPIVHLTALPTSVEVGDPVTLTWDCVYATDAVASSSDNSFTGTKALTGVEVVTTSIVGEARYALRATGVGGSTRKIVTVQVTTPGTPAPTVDLTASASSIQVGQSFTASWTSTDATALDASGSWSGSKTVPSGSQVITPPSAGTYTYTLTATGAGGTAQDSVTVTVTGTPAPTLTLVSSAGTVILGGSFTLSWTSANASTMTASGAWSGSKTLNGSEVQTPTAVGSYTYTLTATGPGGQTSQSVTVVVSGSGGGTIATYGLTQGPATFGLVLPQGITPDGVQVGSLTTQTDVKTRWPDGTIRYAVVSAQIPSTGNYALSVGPVSGAAFTPTWPTATVVFVISGVTWTATLGSFTGTDSWLSGSVVREARVTVRPMNGATSHPLLEVVFDVRSYAAGGHRIDFTVQNVRDTVLMDKVACSSVVLTVNGSAVWSHGAVTSYSFTRWRKTYEVNHTPSQITPDLTPTYAAAVLPKILTTVNPATYDLTTPQYDIMGGPASFPSFAFGEMNPDMGAGGGRQEIAALCWWEARYLVHKTQNLRQTVLRNADLTGCWSNHLSKPDGTTIHLGDAGYSAANWWWDWRSTAGNRPLAPLYAPTNFRGAREGLSADSDTGAAGVAAQYNDQHVPAPMFVAYLLTGDRFYLDQAKFWAVSTILHKFPGWADTDPVNFAGWLRGRNGATGNERILDDSGMTREFGWPIRLLGYTAWMVPDSDPDKTYFVDTVQNNLTHAAAYYDYWVAHNYGGAIGMLGGAENPGGWSTIRNGQQTGRITSTWRLAYTGYSVDWCTRQGLWTISASVQAFVDRLALIHIRMNMQNPQFLAGKAGLSYPYYPAINTMAGGVFTKWLDTFAEIKTYNETYLYENDPCVGNCSTWDPNQPQTGYYNVEHHVMLRIGIRRGLPDAQAAYDRLIQVAGHVGDLNNRAGFAITF